MQNNRKKNSCLIFAPHGEPYPTFHAMRYDNFKNIKYRKSISFFGASTVETIEKYDDSPASLLPPTIAS